MNLQMPPYSHNSPFSIQLSTPLFRTGIQIWSSKKFQHTSSFSPFAYPFCAFRRWHTNKRFNKVIKCSFQGEMVLEPKDAVLLVSRCITRTLPPALSLVQGLDTIQEAVEKLKSKPPCTSSGMFRFEVAVPPSAKAFSLFCSQHDSTDAYPLFFVSKEENPTEKSLALGRTCGVFGIGSAAFIKNTFSHAHLDYGERKRYHASQSTFPMAYGFLDVDIDLTISSMKHETGSFYLFIPQIELNELNEVPVLIATLAWNCSSFCFFKDAVQAYELCLYQIRNHFPSCTDECSRSHIRYGSKNFTVKQGENLQLVCMSAARLGRILMEEEGTLELVSPLSRQFSALLSRDLLIANNISQSDHFLQLRRSILKCANINTVWASLIIEECTRLGLTYICVAPGSRSSPLAIAASTHPLTTCVACIDERSLAFHAVGYARGSRKSAVIITSSGTAASNLLPAVVEASQDFLPLLILTADRPPELQDVGANQAINQVNHFGPFVRHFFGLSAPSDEVSARTVLTTIDSAINIATSSPCGPVHINCPFREPLENIPKAWANNCLKGLDLWLSNAEPYTTYIQGQYSNLTYQMNEVGKLIQTAEKGLLIIGAIQTEDEIWSALLLAKHLSWPVAVDVLSGLRMRKHTNNKENILFIDHLDYLLLSEEVKEWMQPDVVIQLGSRITSVRISEMLDRSLPHYIMVERHPKRHDPMHIVTHRVKCKISEFTEYMIKGNMPCLSNKWKIYLQALEMMAAWEASFSIDSEYSLTEPYIAHVIPDNVLTESSIFVGNSMPIRDADMYASNQSQYVHSNDLISRLGLPCRWIQIVGNRGASGIDGLLSTAVGFSAGSNKNVICIVGDVSFLHDTNGLALLGQGKSSLYIARKPMIILVINNHGGAIFSLLPIASTTERRILDQYFYTSHNVSISSLCQAHSVKHVNVQTKMELLDALFTSQQDKIDCVIEVESSIDSTSAFHSNLMKFGSYAADCAMHVLSQLSLTETSLKDLIAYRIAKMECSLYRIKLCTPPTSSSLNYKSVTFYREGFLVTLTLDDGSTGHGEVAPIEIHEESLQDVEEQLRFLAHVLQGANVDIFLPLLKGSFSSWIWNTLGISPGSLFPSVRCGLEMAVLSAMAAREGSSILNILLPRSKDLTFKLQGVRMCALIDSAGSPENIADVAKSLVEEGFTALKIKVARRADPIEDIAVVQEVRRKVGREVELRVDANRNWTYEVAVQFAKAVKNCGLQYIEEPVKDADDMIRFYEETGCPVALDETIYSIQENPIELLKKYAHPGVVALVMKPSAIGGFENTALFAQWAQQRGKMAIVSATFESSLGLSGFIQLSSYLDLQNTNLCNPINKERYMFPAHGLGTYKWLKEDVTMEPLNIRCSSETGFVEASAAEAGRFMLQFNMNQNVVVRKFGEENVRKYELEVDLEGILFSVNISEIGQSNADNTVIFLHGFLGTGEDWIPIMKSVAGSARCVAIDLPGHGGSKLKHQASNDFTREPSLSIDVISTLLCKLFSRISPKKVILVGYSMGARVALYMALKCSDKFERAVLISGSPGLVDPLARMVRRSADDFKACSIVSYGLELFLDSWYADDLWSSLRSHPRFQTIRDKRLQHEDLHILAKVLSDLSIGRQPALWVDLKKCKVPLMLIVGDKDTKFKKIAREILNKISHNRSTGHWEEIIEISNSGHAVHLENPLPVISAIRRFITRKRSVQISTADDIDLKVPPSQKMGSNP